MNGQRKCGVFAQWSIIQPQKRMKLCPLQENGTGDQSVEQKKPE
jgi:hypothetical protein